MNSPLSRISAALLLSMLILSACKPTATQPQQQTPDQGAIHTQAAQTVEAHLTAQVTDTAEPTVPHAAPSETPTTVPPSPTATLEIREPSLTSYSNSEYGFGFDYLSNWNIYEESHAVKLTQGTLAVIIGYMRLEESVSITGTGTLAGDFQTRGAVSFLGRDVARVALVQEDKVKAVYYDSANALIAVDDNQALTRLLFSISLQDPGGAGTDYQAIDIPAATQTEVDQILESFTVSFELPESCTDKAEFVEDVTVPDDTIFSPGETFVKTWRFRNAGSCTWTEQYELVFADGEQMDGDSPIPFPAAAYPGKTIDLSVELTAPGTTDAYSGNWMLRNADGNLFGVGKNSDRPFWVQIKIEVTETVEDLNLGTPTWRDTFDSAANWYLLETENTLWNVKNGRLSMKASSAGNEDEWGISTKPALEDFLLEAVFITGDKCSGLDRYGVLVRSPDPNSGYVFGFSCDGRYRLYKWDGENYTAIQGWRQASSILTGPNQTNRLGFYTQGQSIKLYANGKLIAEFTDSTYDEGRFGLFIGSANTENLEIFVDEISYWILNE